MPKITEARTRAGRTVQIEYFKGLVRIHYSGRQVGEAPVPEDVTTESLLEAADRCIDAWRKRR
jgi:hypothetical protein